MSKNIRLCLLVSIISLHLSLPSLAMENDQDQEVINRITRKIAKYEIKISDLRRLLENFQIKEENQNPKPSPSPREININLRGQTTPLHTHQKISHQTTPQEITQDQIRSHIQKMYNNGKGLTLAQIGERLGYLPDKSKSTPDGNSTGKAMVKKFLDGDDSPSLCNKFRAKVQTGDIKFSPLTDRSPEMEGRRDAPTQRQPVTPITPIIYNKTKKQLFNSPKKEKNPNEEEVKEWDKDATQFTIQQSPVKKQSNKTDDEPLSSDKEEDSSFSEQEEE